MRLKTLLHLIVLVFMLVGCATYQHELSRVRSSLKSSPSEAASLLKEKAAEEGKDQLVYLLDYGSTLQISGDYKASNEALLKADKMADIKNYISLSKEAASLVFNEAQVQYKGDDFENIMINTMLAINFLMLGENESALVETRRINEKIDLFKSEQQKSYQKSSFAVYLSAMIWEANKSWDDAYIAYAEAYKLDPTNPFLPADLIRSARKAQRWQSYKKWKKTFPQQPKENTKKRMAEVVIIHQQGWGPRKYPSPEWYRIPRLYPVRSETDHAALVVEGHGEHKTQKVYDVEAAAIKTLSGQYAKLLAKRIAGLVAKKAVSKKVSEENKLLGAALNIFMHVTDVADLRQWATLPQTFQVSRVALPAGKYTGKIAGRNMNGLATGEEVAANFNLKPGEIKFINWRSLQ